MTGFQRFEGLDNKIGKAIEETLGRCATDMYYINTIGTHPAKQGRGYGSVLSKTVLDEVILLDSLGVHELRLCR